MIEKNQYYLKNEVKREIIAPKGYARIIKDHRMERIFSDLVEAIGLKNWKNG